MIDKVCHLETALLYSQGRSNVIAASDSVKIQFNLRHRGHRMCNRMLGMYNLPHCLKTRISPLCRPSHRMLCVPQHAIATFLWNFLPHPKWQKVFSSFLFLTFGSMSHWVAAPLTLELSEGNSSSTLHQQHSLVDFTLNNSSPVSSASQSQFPLELSISHSEMQKRTRTAPHNLVNLWTCSTSSCLLLPHLWS